MVGSPSTRLSWKDSKPTHDATRSFLAAPSLRLMTSAGDAFLLRTDPGPGDGPLVAVKDLIDVAGLPTTAGCRAVAEEATPAPADADCVARLRAGGARLVGKTALHELAFGVTGVNAWYGTPANPLDPSRVPGGSSSGSAVAVAAGEADFALGTDTGGSVRIPAACCGVVGLKTTWGSLPLEGLRPLAPSFDTVGPMGATVAAVAAGFDLLAGPAPAPATPAGGGRRSVARLRGLDGVDAGIDEAVDAALARAGIEAAEAGVEGWDEAFRAHRVILAAEAYGVNGYLLAATSKVGLGEEVRGKLERAAALGTEEVSAAREVGELFRARLLEVLGSSGVLVLPTIPCPPPLVGEAWDRLVWLTAPVNLVGLPALAVPVPLPPQVWSGARASVQLVGPPGSERELLAVGAAIEAGEP